MSFARFSFILAAVPFTLLAALWLVLEQVMPGRPGTDRGWVFALCGGIFIYGSIFALRGRLSLRSLVWAGLLLNLLGAVVWIPALGYRSGSSLGFIGAGLTALWVKAVYDVFREERH